VAFYKAAAHMDCEQNPEIALKLFSSLRYTTSTFGADLDFYP